MSQPEIIVLDDNLPENDPLLLELRLIYDTCKVFKHSQDGLDCILNSLQKKLVVVLDINFANGEKNGHEILKEIREHNKLIPVIIWSVRNGISDDFSDFINNHALYYVNKTEHTDVILKRIEDANHHLQLDIATAIESWLSVQDNKDQVISVDAGGKEYSANDLMAEIRMQTSEGRKIEEGIIQLTIDLLFRKKETI